MRFPLLSKGLVAGLLILAILIPLQMIQGTISERQGYHRQAVDSVEQSYAGAQTILGPMVVVPYVVEVDGSTTDEHGVPHPTTTRVGRQWTFFPRTLRIGGSVIPGERFRGIHKVLVYELAAKLHAHFAFELPAQAGEGRIVEVGKPVLGVAIDDVRGLVESPVLRVDGRVTPLLQGAGAGALGRGLHGELPVVAAGQSRVFDVDLDLHLGGTEQLALAPVADDNRFELTSNWPSPQFGGRFLPHERDVSAKGFSATWTIPALAANTQSALAETVAGHAASPDLIQLDLVEPINVYSMAERASKYGILFVLLTFVAFLLFELVKALPIHPVQYLLVGMALAIFFLLLLSLSEHMAFPPAYLIASAACIGLQGFYLSFVLRSAGRGLGFAAMLTVLYGALFGLLQSEDNALLLGSLLLFAILATIMVLTRKIDWYAIAPAPVKPAIVVPERVQP